MKLLITPILCFFVAACAGPMKLYNGPERKVEELGRIYLQSTPTLTSDFNTTITSIDDRDFKREPVTSMQAYILPGKHRTKVTFIDFDNIWTMSFITEKVFQGYYDIEFDSQANKSYIAMFDTSVDKSRWPEKICILERDIGSSSLGTSGKSVGCASPSIPPTEENIKVCMQFNGKQAPSVYAKFCNYGR